jgi:hypothetical protein
VRRAVDRDVKIRTEFDMTPIAKNTDRRHGRARRGHPRGEAASMPQEEVENEGPFVLERGGWEAWIAGTSPAVTRRFFQPLVR